MSNNTSDPSKPVLDDHLKTLGLALGLASTVLGLFIAVKTNFIQQKVDATQANTANIQAELLRQNSKLNELKIKDEAWQMSVRLEPAWQVMTANEFARQRRNPNAKFVWVDTQLQAQLMKAADDWERHRNLMGRAADQSLLLRQVIGLRLRNVGNNPATKIELVAYLHDFEGPFGGQGGPFGAFKERLKSQEPQKLPVGDLMEGPKDRQQEPSEIFIPLAQALGSQRYIGRVVLPLQVQMHNPRMDKSADPLLIDTSDTRLTDRMLAADLGFSKQDKP